jgi:hypothetical protein
MFGAVCQPRQAFSKTWTKQQGSDGKRLSRNFSLKLSRKSSGQPGTVAVPLGWQLNRCIQPCRRASRNCLRNETVRILHYSERRKQWVQALSTFRAVVDKDASGAELPLRWRLSSVSPPPLAARDWIAQPKPASSESEYTDKAPLFAKIVRSHCFGLPWAALMEMQRQTTDNEGILLAALASASPRASIFHGNVPCEPYPKAFTKDGLVLEIEKKGSRSRHRKPEQAAALVTASRQMPLGILIDPKDDSAVPVFVAARYPLSSRQRTGRAADVVAVAAIAASPLGIANGLLDVVIDELSSIVRHLHPSIPLNAERERAIRRSMVAAIGPSPPNAEFGFITVQSDLLNAIFLPWEDRPHVGTTRRCYFVHDIYRDVHSVICRSRRSRTSFTFLAQRRAGRGPGISNPVPLPEEPLGIKFPLQEWHLRLAPLVYERLRCIGVGQVELTRVSLPRVPPSSAEDTRHFSYILLD